MNDNVMSYKNIAAKPTVLITGASSGIGRAVVTLLDSVGYSTVLVSRRTEMLHELAASLEHEALCVPYDLSNIKDIESIFKRCAEKEIKLFGLVHCAGINRDQPVRTNNTDDMVEVMNINLMSFIELAKYFYSKKYSEDGGSIIAMSSTAVYGCDKGMCTYAASKAGIDAAVKVMSKEFSKRKIRVNSIQPTYTDTPMGRNTVDWENKFAAQPLGVVEPMYIGYLVEFLLSEKSKYISGSNIKVSSGAI